MKQGLEQLSGSEGTQERVIQIYIGIKNNREFNQNVIGDCIGKLQYLDNLAKRVKGVHDIPIDGIELEFIGRFFASLIHGTYHKKYEVKNGYYVDKKTKKIIKVERLTSERELELMSAIQCGLIELSGCRK